MHSITVIIVISPIRLWVRIYSRLTKFDSISIRSLPVSRAFFALYYLNNPNFEIQPIAELDMLLSLNLSWLRAESRGMTKENSKFL